MKTRFCIVTTQRTGSSWLVSLLNSHPRIRAVNEPFLYKRDRPLWDEGSLQTFFQYTQQCGSSRPLATLRYMNMMASTCAPAGGCVGFKLMYNQLLAFPEIVPGLLRDRYRLIHLVRRNALDIHLSLEAAKLQRRYHSSRAAEPVRGMVIQPATMLKAIQRQQRKCTVARLVLAALRLPRHEVEYADLISRHEDTVQALLGFLGISERELPLSSSLRKINAGSYREKIRNYDAVRAALDKAGHSWMLNE